MRPDSGDNTAGYSGDNSIPAPTPTAGQSASHRAMGGAIAWFHIVIPPVINIPVRAPAYLVPPGYVVRVRAASNVANQNPVQIATRMDAFLAGHAITLMPLDDVQMQISNLADLWVSTKTVTDGVNISVMQQVGAS